MNAAIVQSFESPPSYGTFADPVPGPDEVLVSVRAAALSPLVKSQTAGKHYSSEAVFPFVPGVDGVGTLPDGARVYFAFPKRPYGAMAERVAVRTTFTVPVPDGLDDAVAAAIANPGMSSWAALTARAKFVPGETVLVNGATGAAGRLAVQIAKHLGAKKVIATGRNQARLDALPALGADVVISLEQPEAELARRFRQELGEGVNVVLDYLWGRSAEQILAAVPGGEARLRFVQIGSISGHAISLPGAVLRSSGLELLGSGLGSCSYEDLVAAIGEVLKAVAPAKLRIEMETLPLTEVEAGWSRDTGDRRLVFTL
ncbi:MAG TPA: zinc-binding alcohol dehydrogenase family protein [Thermoanaerobaculia bacterium]|nr:zinc-binding alcohol dehydrogenase family protein [Thermoanaerobaculia bacterium]